MMKIQTLLSRPLWDQAKFPGPQIISGASQQNTAAFSEVDGDCFEMWKIAENEMFPCSFSPSLQKPGDPKCIYESIYTLDTQLSLCMYFRQDTH